MKFAIIKNKKKQIKDRFRARVYKLICVELPGCEREDQSFRGNNGCVCPCLLFWHGKKVEENKIEALVQLDASMYITTLYHKLFKH